MLLTRYSTGVGEAWQKAAVRQTHFYTQRLPSARAGVAEHQNVRNPPLNPDSAVKPKISEARRNPEAAKASGSEVAKSFCAHARRCYEALHPLPVLSIDVSSVAKPIVFAAQGLRLALSVDRNCRIRVELSQPHLFEDIFEFGDQCRFDLQNLPDVLIQGRAVGRIDV